jgi:hypothetical protein
MSEAATEATTAPAQEQSSAEQSATSEPQDWQAEATRLREELTKARKWEERAKENSAAAKAAEKARLDAMSETERAIEEAKQSARSEAATEYGKRLARTEFDAAAGRRNPDFDTAKALQYLDLKTLLDENGEPDIKAIKVAVADLVPEASAGAPDYDGGARTTAPTSDFNQVLRRAAGRA